MRGMKQERFIRTLLRGHRKAYRPNTHKLQAMVIRVAEERMIMKLKPMMPALTRFSQYNGIW